jgi:hypothetical protein
MSDPRFIGAPDVLDRHVLFAVELVDPVTQSITWRGLTVTADGIQAKPIISRSGRFVWLIEKDAWPGVITVDPGRTPFTRQTQPAPPRPADLLTATPAERLVRIALGPTPAYPFDTGATVVRGGLKERVDIPNAPAVAAAVVQLAWHDAFTNVWRPGPPLPGEAWPQTDANGEFAALVRLIAQPAQDPDLSKGLLRARVQVTRGLETRATPDNFPFLPNAADAGRVPEGQLLSQDLTLGWMQLVAI